jgi:8-oxo-dGTP pyrophosphatase MutT (NUDIX family)
MSHDWPERLRASLADREPDAIPETECDLRAAVTLILRSPGEEGGGPEVLFVRRATVEGDPWSGHVALPGGRMDPEDEDLLETARRETREETALELPRADHLGRLRELHPRSRHLPSICVTPFVAWLPSPQDVHLNHELTGHAWIPVAALADPVYRTQLVRESPTRRVFPAIEYGDDVIWGLTFAILEDFLEVCAEAVRGAT